MPYTRLTPRNMIQPLLYNNRVLQLLPQKQPGLAARTREQIAGSARRK